MRTDLKKIAFIWDLDGTLLDSYGIIVSSLHQTLQEFHIDLDESDIHRELITYSLGVFLSKVEREWGVDTEAIRVRFKEINDSRATDIRPVPNAPEILHYLKGCGIPNYVFTHKGKTALAVLKNIGLYDFFEEIVTGEDGFPKKPDPAAINYLIQKHGLDRSKTFYVGDRTLDVACANNAGIRSILYLSEDSPARSDGKQTCIVKDLMGIRKIFENGSSLNGQRK